MSTILIIDDNLQSQARLEKVLAGVGTSVISTNTVEKATDILRYSDVSVILIDYSLPGLSLKKFMHSLREEIHSEYVNVIVLMDHEHEDSEVADSYNLGVVDFIGKDFSEGIIRSMVKTFVKLYDQNRRVRELLLHIFPREIADELEEYGKVKPKRYGLATVMFADFVSFSIISREMSPVELVNQLESYFNEFDRIAQKYHIEKIKTIGDEYMAVAGVPEKRSENPILSALAALEIDAFLQKMRKKALQYGKTPWELRIGLHSGPLVAGVIGETKFAYDVWGDTVNTASRICTACEPGKVNISATTYERIKNYFQCTFRGEIEAKNIGHLGMYFLEGIRPEFSVNGKGKKPNRDLMQISGLLFVQYDRLKEYILDRLEKELPKNLYYHGAHHTRDVLLAAENLGKMEGLDEDEMLVLQTAALLHDCGYLYTYNSNEELAVKMARKILPDFGYSRSQIRSVASIIRATKIRSIPRTRLQKIMNDADYDYLGRKDYQEIAETLFLEMNEQGKNLDRKEWIAKQIRFLERHQYYTESGIKEREKVKRKNIEALQRELLKYS